MNTSVAFTQRDESTHIRSRKELVRKGKAAAAQCLDGQRRLLRHENVEAQPLQAACSTARA
jgi:hypothetical protein